MYEAREGDDERGVNNLKAPGVSRRAFEEIEPDVDSLAHMSGQLLESTGTACSGARGAGQAVAPDVSQGSPAQVSRS